MKIVIDARPAEKGGFGIARYTYELIKALIKIDKENNYILLVNSNKLFGLIEGKKNFSLRIIRSKWMGILEQVEIPWVLFGIKSDLFHATSFVVPFFLPCKTVISILDMIHLVFPGDYSLFYRLYYKIILKHAAQKAGRIITISEHSKKDIIKYFALPAEKIKVVYIAASGVFGQIKDKKTPADPYILAVGSTKPYKNLAALVAAYKRLKAENNLKHKLIIVGGKDVFEEDITAKKAVDDNEMNLLYNSADLFIFPSLYEGFGLPVLEAMACGTPVITSNVSSLPEVAGDAAILVDPHNIDEIAKAILRVLMDNKLKGELIGRGLKRAAFFSWNNCARMTLDCYKELCA